MQDEDDLLLTTAKASVYQVFALHLMTKPIYLKVKISIWSVKSLTHSIS